jgi:hypothetical protein
MGDGCGFCGSATGPFTRVEGLFDVPMCPRCRRERGHPPGPYPAMTPEQHRASLELLPTWVLAQKVVANRALVARVRRRLTATRRRACTSPTGWPGWNAKPTSPRPSSPPARPADAEATGRGGVRPAGASRGHDTRQRTPWRRGSWARPSNGPEPPTQHGTLSWRQTRHPTEPVDNRFCG